MIGSPSILDIQLLVGHGLWQIQALEKTLVHFVVLHRVQRNEPDLADSMFEQRGKFTLGQLISDIQNIPDAPAELKTRLADFLPKRNWYVHKSWSDHYKYTSSPGTLLEFSEMLTAVSDEALALNKQFGDLVVQKAVSSGVSQAYIEEEASRLLNKWFAG